MKKAFIFTALLACISVTDQAATPTPLQVDASDAPRSLLHIRETLAVDSGPLILRYPKWIPGEHGPTGPVTDMAGLRINAGGKTLAWRRDRVDMYALHVQVPDGINQLNITFDFLLPSGEGFSSGASHSPRLVILSWNQLLIYPDGANPATMMILPSVKLPAGWRQASALVVAKTGADGWVEFSPLPLEMLVDSPLLAGAYMRTIDLTIPGGPAHRLNIAADSEPALEIRPQEVVAYRALVREAGALFGGRHYDRYDFLLSLSDNIAHFGLEHHQSSDNRLAERALIDSDWRMISADLLPHEFVHSWNGKHRRPAGLATGDFTTPMQGDLLWVYEGLTQYFGKVLTARTGLWTAEDYRNDLAALAAELDHRPGREWRPLQDTADEAQLLYYARGDWAPLRRETDFYDEGNLLWLEVDARLRQLTAGRRSMNDFAQRFHGGADSGVQVKSYTEADVIATLNSLAAYDWAALLKERLTGLNPRAPLGGIELGGWRLVYDDKPNGMIAAHEAARERVNLRYSLGIVLDKEGEITEMRPESPADLAGLAPGMTLRAVDGRRYSEKRLRAALVAAKSTTTPIEIIAEGGEFFKSYRLDCHGGERHPHLERDPAKPDLLSAIIAPLASAAAKKK